MKLATITMLSVVCIACPVFGQGKALTRDASVLGVVQLFLDVEQLTPDQKQRLEAALSGAVQESEIAPALSELTLLRSRIQEGRRQTAGAADTELRDQFRALQRETEPKLRAALIAADPALAELINGGSPGVSAAVVPVAADAVEGADDGDLGSMAGAVNMSAVRSVTMTLWNEDNLTPEQKAQADAAVEKVLKDPAVAAAMGKLADARKAHQNERAKFPAERNNAVSAEYRRVQKVATDALTAALVAVDPDMAKIMTGKNEGENATDSESGNKKAMVPITDVQGLPRVLLIGDSISIGYTLQVREKLDGKANVHRVPMNAGATEVGLANIDKWLGDGKWDVIHFNFGLHDAKYASATEQRASREQYIANLQQLIDRMKSTGAKLVFATTTPIPEVLEYGKAKGNRMFDGIPERNALAVELMKKNGVAVNDLYAVVLPVRETACRPGDVHFTPEGYEILSTAVAGSIGQQLAGGQP